MGDGFMIIKRKYQQLYKKKVYSKKSNINKIQKDNKLLIHWTMPSFQLYLKVYVFGFKNISKFGIGLFYSHVDIIFLEMKLQSSKFE